MVARIESPNGKSFLLNNGRILDARISGFEDLPEVDRAFLDAGWVMVFGFGGGYKLSLEGRQSVEMMVTPDSIKTDPAGHENEIALGEGNTYTLEGGTKIVPLKN